MKLKLLAALVATGLLAGCAVAPKQLATADMVKINTEDREQVLQQIEPIGATLKIDEAIARALKYNLDQRTKMLEQSLAAGELVAGKYDMLPKLLADAGYDWRDSYAPRRQAPYSDPDNINASTPTVVSVDPKHSTYDLRLSWNILDFGASYYSARQNANKLLIANEKRRKAMHTLAQNVRTAYWRALAAEILSDRIRKTIKEAEQALRDSEKLSSERVTSVDESLRYQRNLLESLRLLESVDGELASARIELSKLIGVLPGTPFKLVEPEVDVTPLDIPMENMEAQALIQNADLREQFLNVRNAVNETHKALLKLLPGITLNYGTYYDNDGYLINNDWKAASVSVSYNLFNLLSGPSRIEASEKNEELAKARRIALQMTVLTQVHLATHQYGDTLRLYKRATKLFDVDRQLEALSQGQIEGNMAGEQRRISASVTTILSELRRYEAMAKFQDAIGRLQSSLGMEPTIESVDEVSLAELTTAVNDWMTKGITSKQIVSE